MVFEQLTNDTNFDEMEIALVVHPKEDVISEVVNWYTIDGIQYVEINGVDGDVEKYMVTECRKDDGRLPY